MNYLISALDVSNMSFGERLVLGLKISFIGVLIVFSLLVVLVLVTKLFEVFIYKRSINGKATVKSVAETPVVSQTAQISVPSSVASNDMPIAAIMAALSVVLQQETQNQSNVKFVVRSIKKF